MNPTLAQRLDRYDSWLDHAEDQIDAWFNATQVSNPSAPGAPIDHRALNSIVLTLRRVITLRQTLRDWSRREPPPAPPESPGPSQEAMEAWDRVLSFYRAEDPKPSDAHHNHDDPHDNDAPLQGDDFTHPADVPPLPDTHADGSPPGHKENLPDADPDVSEAIPSVRSDLETSGNPITLPKPAPPPASTSPPWPAASSPRTRGRPASAW